MVLIFKWFSILSKGLTHWLWDYKLNQAFWRLGNRYNHTKAAVYKLPICSYSMIALNVRSYPLIRSIPNAPQLLCWVSCHAQMHDTEIFGKDTCNSPYLNTTGLSVSSENKDFQECKTSRGHSCQNDIWICLYTVGLNN